MINEIKKALFINTILAEESLKESIEICGPADSVTMRKRVKYETLLQVIEDSGSYEEYRGFRIMVALRVVKEGSRCRLLSA